MLIDCLIELVCRGRDPEVLLTRVIEGVRQSGSFRVEEDAELLQKYKQLKISIDLKATGATVHKLHDILSAALLAADAGELDLFNKYATQIDRLLRGLR